MLLRIYMAVVMARWRPLRCAGFGLLSLAFLLGSSPQFGVRKAHLVVGTLALAGGAAAAPLPPTVLAAAAPLSLLALVAVLPTRHEDRDVVEDNNLAVQSFSHVPHTRNHLIDSGSGVKARVHDEQLPVAERPLEGLPVLL